jgi:translation elongation factor EF-Tu-like GTPase
MVRQHNSSDHHYFVGIWRQTVYDKLTFQKKKAWYYDYTAVGAGLQSRHYAHVDCQVMTMLKTWSQVLSAQMDGAILSMFN